MAITKDTHEIKLGVSAKRIFKALVTEPYTNLPKILPHVVKSVELLHGDGGAGTIKQTNFADGSHVKYKVDAIDVDNQVVKYTLIDGSVLGEKLESIYYEQIFEDSSEGGCVTKIVGEYRPKGGVELKEEDTKAAKAYQATEFYKLAEEYLVANPDACV